MFENSRGRCFVRKGKPTFTFTTHRVVAVDQIAQKPKSIFGGTLKKTLKYWFFAIEVESLSNLILVFVCLLLGFAFQNIKRFPSNTAETLNTYVIYVALPALVIYEIAKLSLDFRALQPVVIAWIIMTTSAIAIYSIARILRWSRSITGAMLLVVALGNTGFVGIPLIEAHLGQNAIPYAILYDQFGTFLALNTYGIAVASYFGQEAGQQKAPLWKNIVTFPPFIALLCAFALKGIDYPEWLNSVLSRLASTLVPVVMVAVGFQWKLKLERQHVLPLAIALVFTLVLQPIYALLVTSIGGVEGLVAEVIILEAAMPAMISAGVLATAYNLAPRLASSVVGYSLMLSLGSVWIWKWLIQ